MARLVLKFGGTSLANITRIEHAASIVAKEITHGHQLVVVVSAMAGFTDQLSNIAFTLEPHKRTPAHDMALSAGEQVSVGLFVLALSKLGIKSQGLLGWQVPINTDASPTEAKMQSIPPQNLEFLISQNIVPVVAGFQGIDEKGQITTLGRGGSDTSAVGLAIALSADRCDIYTDVDGVYTADPRIIPLASKLESIPGEVIYELSCDGAKVLHHRAVELALKYGVSLAVKSCFTLSSGTIMTHESTLEDLNIYGLAHSEKETMVKLEGISEEQINSLLSCILKHNLHPEMIAQILNPHLGGSDLSFLIPSLEVPELTQTLESHRAHIQNISTNSNVAKLALVGLGIRGNPQVLAKLMDLLQDHGVRPHTLITTDIKISMVIDKDKLIQVGKAIHKVFGLDQQNIEAA